MILLKLHHYVTILQGPVRPFGWDMKDQWRARWMSAATVLDRWASVSSYVGGTVARSRSKSTGGICSRVAHVCLRINPNCRWYMRFLQTFRECSILLPVFAGPVRNFQKFCGCRFYRESAYPDTFWQFGWHNKANTGVRWVHITTRNETPRKTSPTPNKYRKRWIFSNSPFSLHYVTILEG